MNKTHNTSKCQTCGKVKALDQFYTYHTRGKSRASPHCIACNPKAVLLTKYRRQIRVQGKAAFLEQMKHKEHQLATMTQALSEVQV
jgi:uncharacterized protein with PIN domain